MRTYKEIVKNYILIYGKTIWENNGEDYFENPSVRSPTTILMSPEYKSYIQERGRYHTLDIVRVD